MDSNIKKSWMFLGGIVAAAIASYAFAKLLPSDLVALPLTLGSIIMMTLVVIYSRTNHLFPHSGPNLQAIGVIALAIYLSIAFSDPWPAFILIAGFAILLPISVECGKYTIREKAAHDAKMTKLWGPDWKKNLRG